MKSDTRRLFFGYWPDQEVRRAIIERRKMLGDLSRRRVPDRNLHLTLLFLGDQPVERVDDILAAAGVVTARQASLNLNRFGWFPRARVAWLGGEAPDATRRLVSDLAEVLTGLGIEHDHRPFHAHVTLFRQVRKRPDFPEPPPLEWSPAEFALIESISSQPYQVLRKWSVE